jgi:hypothetical protein
MRHPRMIRIDRILPQRTADTGQTNSRSTLDYEGVFLSLVVVNY